MKLARFCGGVAALCAFVAIAVLYAHVPARSFDLQGSPTLVNRPAADITDTYFFPSPTNPNNVVAVMDVNPLIPPAQALSAFFQQGVLYTMKFDNQYGNSSVAVGSKPTEDLVLQFSFSAPTGPAGQQTQQLFVYGPIAPAQTGTSTTLVNGGLATGTGFVNKSFSVGGIAIFAGARRDPAFLNGTSINGRPQGTPGTFFGIFPGQNPNTSTGQSCLPGGTNTCPQGFSPGNDLFAGYDVLSIVVEIPKLSIVGTGNGVVAYWATTSTSTGQ